MCFYLPDFDQTDTQAGTVDMSYRILLPGTGLPKGHTLSDPGSSSRTAVHHVTLAAAVQANVKSNLITATSAGSGLGCLLMGLGANLPLATAPGMGLNAYFAYNVVGYRGSGDVRLSTSVSTSSELVTPASHCVHGGPQESGITHCTFLWLQTSQRISSSLHAFEQAASGGGASYHDASALLELHPSSQRTETMMHHSKDF